MTDWLARKHRGVIDFTLPDDRCPFGVRLAFDLRRIAEYQRQALGSEPKRYTIAPGDRREAPGAQSDLF